MSTINVNGSYHETRLKPLATSELYLQKETLSVLSKSVSGNTRKTSEEQACRYRYNFVQKPRLRYVKKNQETGNKHTDGQTE